MPRGTGKGFVGLDPFGIMSAVDAASCPYADEIRAFFEKGSSSEGAPRIRDIIDFVCYRCALPLSFVWAWMCTDFPFCNLDSSNWRPITISYIEGNLTGLDFMEMEAVSSSLRQNGLRPSLRTALKSQRRCLGLSLRQMALRLGMERGDVASLEHGSHPMSIPRCRTFNAVMEGYEVHPMRLLQLAYTSAVHIP